MNALELAHAIVHSLENKKAENITLMDLQEIASFTDYFVICTGTSDRMLDALAKGVVDDTHEKLDKKGRIEGYASAGWLVVDYGVVIVHIFAPEQRQYYKLEELWNKGKVLLRLQ